MKILKFILIIMLFFLFMPIIVFAQIPEIKFRHIGMEEGLSQISINNIEQDDNIYI